MIQFEIGQEHREQLPSAARFEQAYLAGELGEWLQRLELCRANGLANTNLAVDEAPTWLNDVYALVSRGDPDSAAHLLCSRIDELLLSGQFARCNELLQAIDLKRLDCNLVVTLLAFTRLAKEALPFRPRLCERARARLLCDLAPDRVERLLRHRC
ncbi:MAG: hypothetical protein RBU37_12295 [Myxococcota bacterium]|jgi:hypothetical protein|nr:hypothetical protein [Myxococcota bacterium]